MQAAKCTGKFGQQIIQGIIGIITLASGCTETVHSLTQRLSCTPDLYFEAFVGYFGRCSIYAGSLECRGRSLDCFLQVCE